MNNKIKIFYLSGAVLEYTQLVAECTVIILYPFMIMKLFINVILHCSLIRLLIDVYFNNNEDIKYAKVALIIHLSCSLLDLMHVCASLKSIEKPLNRMNEIAIQRLQNLDSASNEYLLAKCIIRFHKTMKYTYVKSCQMFTIVIFPIILIMGLWAYLLFIIWCYKSQ